MAKNAKFGPGKSARGGSLGGKAPSSTKRSTPRGIDPNSLGYGIANTSRKQSGAITASTSRSVPSNQGQLTRKAKRQVQ